jgi:hypothetical protein
LTLASLEVPGKLGEPGLLRVTGIGLEARRAFVSPKV